MGELKIGYRLSEVGLIPDDWDVKPLGKICDAILDGTHYTPRYVTDGIPFYSVENVTADNFTNPKFISREEHALLTKRCKPEKGDILLTRIGSLGATKLIDWDVDASIYVSLALLKINKEIDPRYLYCYTKSHQFVLDIVKRSLVNATPQKINLGDINLVPIPVPPTLTEQRAIADALSEVDDQIAALDDLIAKKRDLKQGAIQRLLTGEERLPGFSGEWEIDSISNLASITTGDKNTQDNVEDGKYPFFVRSAIVERINSYTFDGEAVLTAGDGVGTGKIFHYIDGKFDFHQRVYKISDFTDRLNGYFFYLYFSTHFYERIMSMTAKSSVDSVRMEVIAGMQIPLPHPDEQIAIATVLSDMDAEITTLEAQREKTVTLKQGMMQELLTGKTRLV